MNTPLQFRPVDVRLMIAYIADAHFKFPVCNPDNTFGRMTNESTHPYTRIWNMIGGMYRSRGWDAMSDPELRDLYKTFLSTEQSTGIKPMDVIAAKQRWANRGWTRYEHKRDGRRSVARRYGLMGVGVVAACFGIALPTNA